MANIKKIIHKNNKTINKTINKITDLLFVNNAQNDKKK